MNDIGGALGIPAGGWSHGISRLFDQGDIRLVWLLRTLSRKGASSAASRNLRRATQFVHAEVMLTLITASREHAPAITTATDDFIDTYGQGGLDFLGAEMNQLGLPRSITSHWTSQAPVRNLESGSIIQPAQIPSRDQVLAYAAQINASFERRFLVFLKEELGTLAPAALGLAARAAILVWKAYAFLAPGGAPFNGAKTLKSQLGQRFGIHSCLQYIKHSNKSLPLNAIFEDSALNQSEWIRIAKVRVAESLFLERVLQTTRDVLLPVIPGVP